MFASNDAHVTKAKVVRLKQIRLLGKIGKNKMRKMKNSGIEWIGEIPEDWEVGRVKNCYIHHKYVVGDNADNYERLALTLNGVIKRSKVDATGLQPEAFEGYQILRQNELVFKLIDLENVSTSRVGYSPFTGIVSPAYIVLNPRNEKESRFGEYFFLSMWQREVFNHLGDDGVRSSLNAKDLLDIPYPLVSSDEKQKIVTFLDCKCSEIDSVISKTKSSIEEYKKLKQSIITETVTGKVKIENGKVCGKYDTYKDSGVEWIGEIPSDWDCFYLSQIFYPVKNKNIGMQETNLLSLSYGKIIRKNIETTFGLLPENFEGYNIIERDNIVLRLTDLQNDHKSLRVGLVTEKGIITSAYLTLKNKTNMSSNYFYYLLHSFDIAKGFYGMGAGVRQGLNWNEIRSLRIISPKESFDQQQIADFLDKKCSEIDKLITKKEQLVVELEAYKKSLIYEVVTGKRSV